MAAGVYGPETASRDTTRWGKESLGNLTAADPWCWNSRRSAMMMSMTTAYGPAGHRDVRLQVAGL